MMNELIDFGPSLTSVAFKHSTVCRSSNTGNSLSFQGAGFIPWIANKVTDVNMCGPATSELPKIRLYRGLRESRWSLGGDYVPKHETGDEIRFIGDLADGPLQKPTALTERQALHRSTDPLALNIHKPTR